MTELDHRVRCFGGWDDVESLLASYAGAPGPNAPGAARIELPVLPPGLAGQTGIRLRQALISGDGPLAAALAVSLDQPHRVELLLGAALRDARGDWAAARLWLAAEQAPASPARWWPTCRLLAEPGADHALDELASAYVAERRVPEGWSAAGSSDVPAVLDDRTVAEALARGTSGYALLDALADRPLYTAVSHYYRQGTIHALGPRPLLVLAASSCRS